MSFSIEFSDTAMEDYQYWKKTNNKKVIKKIKILLKNITETPFEGIGKPEALKYDFTGYWSRSITREHRIVYKVDTNIIYVIQLRGHY
ncbi:MAG: Txe/YoeB family addiction module toxin [Flavobacterium sp.]|nr:MAG: Txe/YoeB family addiction module toxin [Flavobacterium sp.]